MHIAGQRMPTFTLWPTTSRKARKITAAFRVTGRVPERWDADTGKMSEIAGSREINGRTEVPLTLEANASTFVVFRKPQNLDNAATLGGNQSHLGLADTSGIDRIMECSVHARLGRAETGHLHQFGFLDRFSRCRRA